MAIFDWWEAVREYIFQEIDNVQASPERQVVGRTPANPPNTSFELKLNVTDSELVLVENSSQWDSNAVILKVRVLFVLYFCLKHKLILEHHGSKIQTESRKTFVVQPQQLRNVLVHTGQGKRDCSVYYRPHYAKR